MSAGPGSALGGPRAGSVQVAGSAVVVGTARLGEGSILAEGAVIRSEDSGVEVGTGSAVLENSVIVGNAVIPTVIGRRSVFGHRCMVIGAVVGDLCVQILENTVLHLLPDNDLVLDDGVVIGPGAMIHGCRIGAGSVVEPGAIVCDHSVVGAGCVVRAGAVVKQRSRFDAGIEIDGFPAVEVGRASEPPEVPSWAFSRDDLPVLERRG